MQKKYKLSLALLSLMALSACDLNFGSSSSLSSSSSSSSNSSSSSDTSTSSSDASSSDNSSSSDTSVSSSAVSSSSSSSSAASSETSIDTAYDHFYKQTEAMKYNYNDITKSVSTFSLPSTGSQKILVIPVIINGYPFLADTLTDIEKTFAGEASDTGWQSLKSFYATSSFASLSLDITVTDAYYSGYTPAEMAANGIGGDLGTYTILENAVTWYKTQTGTNLTSYDQNDDGFIDNVWLVYSCPNYFNGGDADVTAAVTGSGDNPFWAFTYWDVNGLSDLADPAAYNYAWASFDFMYEGYGHSALDAHTYIHETGHILGLDDYYNYDSTSENVGPGLAGAIDMMDYNVTDHDMFSKIALGWAKPYIVTGNAEITINPSQENGDCILIPRAGKTYAGHPFDEYILLELYTPTGLNQSDSESQYSGRYPLGYTIPGIKLYHIDARFIRWTYSVSKSQWIAGYYTSTFAEATSNMYYAVGNSNTPSRSANANYSLVHLIEAGGTNTFKNGYVGTDETLFTTGTSFSLADYGTNFFYNQTKMNDGMAFGYSIAFTSVSSVSATVSITKI